MSSLGQQRTPPQTISNWFSSLRRQPKNKKHNNSSNSNDKKKIQRSCDDLTSNSTFYIENIQSPNLNTYNGKDFIDVDDGSSSTTTDDNDKRRLVNKRQTMRDFCSNCCCQLSKTQSSSPNLSTRKNLSTQKNLSPLNLSPLSPTSIERSENREFRIETDRRTDICLSKLPNVELKKYSTVIKTEFKKTTTTTLTRTRIISDVKKLEKYRTHSLGSILDSPTSLDGVELLFIDESSDSSNMNVNNNNNNYNKNSVNLSQQNISNTNNFNNNNNNNDNDNNDNDNDTINNSINQILCDDCRTNIDIGLNAFDVSSSVQIKDELCEVVSEMEALDSQEDCKHSNKDKQTSIGRKKFNMDPKKGIEYLVDNHLLQLDAQQVALFLYKGEGLNKTAIGDYLGEKNDFNEQVLKCFVELHDFTNLILVQALRQFLWSFRLPGEAQKIDRMMETFAQRYCQLNPDIFTNTDTCYVLSFAIIMLNTSLHNPSVKEKPTVEQFISMNRGINNGGDLSRGLLESLYESIRTEPFKIPQDDGNDLMHTFFNPDKEGWLWKQGGRYKSWKRRWFILNDNCLYYFEYTTDKEPRGIIPLENISVREIQDRSKPFCFELYACGGAEIIKACKTDSEGKVVEGKHTVYRMSAATEEDKQEWIKRLTQSISHNPFYNLLVQRKKNVLANS